MRSSSEGDVDGPLSESLEFELMEGGRSGLAGAWFDPCSKLFVVLALAGVFPVVILLPLPEPAVKPTLGGISSDSLDECVGGGLDKVLCSRLELDDSAAGRAPLEAAMTAAASQNKRSSTPGKEPIRHRRRINTIFYFGSPKWTWTRKSSSSPLPAAAAASGSGSR